MQWFICSDGICDFCADGRSSFVWGIGSSTFFRDVGHNFVFEGRDNVCSSFGGCGGRGGASWGSGSAGGDGESLSFCSARSMTSAGPRTPCNIILGQMVGLGNLCTGFVLVMRW